MWKAAFTGRSDKSDVGSIASGRKKKSRTSDSTASGPSSRRHSEDKRPNKLTEGAIKALNGANAYPDDDGEWEDEDKDARSERRSRKDTSRDHDRKRKSTRSERARSDSRERYGGKDRDEQRRSKHSRSSKSEGRESSERALPDMGSMEQFPGQHTMLGPTGSLQPSVTMSSALPSSTPNQQFSFGAAADYYEDQGQSVQTQPGVRPVTPNMLVNPSSHLMTPSVQPNPALDTGNGTAADFYNAQPEVVGQSSSAKLSKRPSKSSKVSSSTAASAAGIGALGMAAASSMNSTHQSSSTSYQTSSYPQTQSSGKPSRTSNNTATVTAATAAGAGLAAYGLSQHNKHSTPQRPQSDYTHHPSTHYHEHKGPVTRLKDGLLNLISSPEDVQKMEEYTEYIGVCKYCFDPHSSPLNAPRRHHYHKRRDTFEDLRRRRSNERLKRRDSDNSLRRKGSTRVGKDNRYFSEATHRQDSNGNLIAAGLAAAGLPAGANALFNDRKDFDDTYSVKSGHRESSAMRQRSRSSSREKRRRSSHGAVSGKEEYVTVRTRDGKIEKRKIMRRTRSRSADRRDGKSSAVLSAALGATAASAAVGSSRLRRQASPQPPSRRRSSRSPHRNGEILGYSDSKAVRTGRRAPDGSYYEISRRDSSPQQSNRLFGGFFSSPEKDPRRRSKKTTGLFTFSNGSSSSSDSGMAFGDGFASRSNLSLSKRKSRRNSDERLAATVAGIGATAAALTAAQKRRNMDSRAARADLLARRNPRKQYTTNEPEDDEWEDALPSDVSDASSVSDSGLAFGGSTLSHRQSMESVSSGQGGLGAWAWRWARGQSKKSKRRPKSRVSSYSTEVLPDSSARASQSSISRPYPTSTADGSGVAHPAMQYVDPQPLENDSQFDSRQASGAMPGSWNEAVRPSDPGPIQAPRPIPTQQASFVRGGQQFDDAHSSRPYPTRTQSFPVQSSFARDAALIGGAALATAGIIASSRKGKEPTKDVRFGLTDDQQRKEDKTSQRRQERAERREREAEEERQREDRARALKDEAAWAARVEDARLREEEVRQRREAENRRAAELELTREAEARRAAELDLQNRRSSNDAASESQRSSRRRESGDAAAKTAKGQRRKSSGYSQPRVEDEPSEELSDPSRKADIAAGAAVAIAAGAGIAYANKTRDQPDDQRYQTTQVVPKDSSYDCSDAETYSAKKVTPDGQNSGAPMMDDDILDKEFFKRKRSDSEFAREERRAEIARKAADKVVADMDEYYNQPAQDQADFFAPKELLSQPSESKTRAADPHSDNDVHVYHVDRGSPIEAVPRSPTSLTQNKHPSYGVPSLNVIAPTPPPSATSSVRGKGSTPSSPLAQAVDTSSKSSEEPTRRTASDNPRRISWGQDKTHVYDAQTPESYEERNSYMDARDKPVTESSTKNSAFANIVMQAAAAKKSEELPYDTESTPRNDSGPAEVSRDVESSSDVPRGFDERNVAQTPSDSADLEQDTTSEPVLSKKEQKKLDKAKARDAFSNADEIAAETQQDSSAVPANDTEDAWEAPLSKKERKKREKAAAKRLSLGDDEAPSAAEEVSAPPDPRSEIVVVEEADEPFLSKKEKKKRDKAAKRMSVDNDPANNDRDNTIAEPEPEVSIPEASRELDLSGLSKKERKKAEKEIKKQGFADIASALMTPAGITAVSKVVDLKQEDSARDAVDLSKLDTNDAKQSHQDTSRMPGSWDEDSKTDDKEEVDPFQFQVTPTPPAEIEDDPFEAWSSSKKKKKSSKSKKRESATFNEPIVSSPLKTTMVSVDSATQDEAEADPYTYESPSRERAPQLVRTESVVSAPILEHYRLTKTDSNRSRSQETDPDAYDSRSVAASEPVDLYESVRKSKHRSKYDDDDDTSSIGSKRRSKRFDEDDDTVSVRSSRKDRDDSNGPKKEKRGSLLSNIFSRKSTESVPQRRQSVPDPKTGSDDEADRKHRKKKHRDSRHEDDDDDGANTRRDSSDTRRKQRRDRDKREEDSRERRRSRESTSRKADTDDEREVVRRRSRAESSPSRGEGEQYQQSSQNEDQSFLGMRVEGTPPLPAHLPESPVAASTKSLEKGFGTPPSAARELQPALSLETLQRTPVSKSSTSTAVPLRFPFGAAKLSPRERSASFSTPSITPTHASPTSSHRKNRPSSSEIRPLYLVERNRKTPEVEEALPSLPSSNPSSRSSSVHEADERVAIGAEWQPEPQSRGLHIHSDHANADQHDDGYLDSAQTTPKASQFNQGFPARESRPQPQFYTWDDFRADELLHNQLSNSEQTVPPGTRATFEADVPPLPESRPGSPYEAEEPSEDVKQSGGFGVTAAIGGAAAIAFAAGTALAALKEADHGALVGKSVTNAADLDDIPASKLSRKQSKKAKKKSNFQAWEPEEDERPSEDVEEDQPLAATNISKQEQGDQSKSTLESDSEHAAAASDAAMRDVSSETAAKPEPIVDTSFSVGRKLSKKEKKKQKRAGVVDFSEAPDATPHIASPVAEDEEHQTVTDEPKKSKRKSVTWNDLVNAEQAKPQSVSWDEMVSAEEEKANNVDQAIGQPSLTDAEQAFGSLQTSRVEETNAVSAEPDEFVPSLEISREIDTRQILPADVVGLDIAAGAHALDPSQAQNNDEVDIAKELDESSAASLAKTKSQEEDVAKKMREKEKTVAGEAVSYWSTLMFGGKKKKKKEKKSKTASTASRDEEAEEASGETAQTPDDVMPSADDVDEDTAAQTHEPITGPQALQADSDVAGKDVSDAPEAASGDSSYIPSVNDDVQITEEEPPHKALRKATVSDYLVNDASESASLASPADAIEGNTNQIPAEEEPTDEFFPMKKSKKDKKKAKKARESLAVLDSPDLEPRETVTDGVDPAPNGTSVSTSRVEEATDLPPAQPMDEVDPVDDFFPIKQSKKDKKKAKKARDPLASSDGPASEPGENGAVDQDPAYTPYSSRELSEDLAGPPTTESTIETNPVDEFLPTKPSKKDKKQANKARASLSQKTGLDDKTATAESSEPASKGPAVENDAADDPPERRIEQVGEDSVLTSTKKDEAKAQRDEETLPALQETSLEDRGVLDDTTLQTSEIAPDGTVEDGPATENIQKPADVDSVDDSFSTGKSKKDKKKAKKARKSLQSAYDSSANAEGAKEPAVDVDPVEGAGDPSKQSVSPPKDAALSEDAPASSTVDDILDAAKDRPNSSPVSGAATSQIRDGDVSAGRTLEASAQDGDEDKHNPNVEEADPDEGLFAFKPSKKDKKKAKKARNLLPSDPNSTAAELYDVNKDAARDDNNFSIQDIVPQEAEQADLAAVEKVDSDVEYTAKKSKKDKKKARKDRDSLATARFEATGETAADGVDAKVQDPQDAVVDNVPMEIANTEQFQDSTQIDPDEEFATKKSKKDKRKAKKARDSLPSTAIEADRSGEGAVQADALSTQPDDSTPVDRDLRDVEATADTEQPAGIAQDIDPITADLHDNVDSQAQDNPLGEVPDVTRSGASKADVITSAENANADDAEDDEWAGFATKRSKKDKKKKKRQSLATAAPEEAARSNFHAAVAESTSPSHQNRPSVDDDASRVPLPLEAQDEWSMDDETTTTTLREHAEPSTSSTASDLGFAATLAAGLADTGFDPELVLKDPTFHRRRSPPAPVAEADPEEAIADVSLSGKKKKKSKQRKSSRSMGTGDVEESQASAPPAKDFLDDVLGQSLQGTGFDANVLTEAAASDANTQSITDLGHSGDRSIASWSRARSPKLRKQSPQSENDSTGQSTQAHVQTFREIVSSDTPNEPSDKDPASDFNVADGREMDIDEMDRQYRAFRKKEKKKKRGQASQASADLDRQSEPEPMAASSSLSRSLEDVAAAEASRSGMESKIGDLTATAAAVAAPTWSFAALADSTHDGQAESIDHDSKAPDHTHDPQHEERFVTPTKTDWELNVPKQGQGSGSHGLVEDDPRPRTPSGASSTTKTPLEPTSKDRASYLFQSPPVYGPAESPAQVNSTSRDLQNVTTPASPSTPAAPSQLEAKDTHTPTAAAMEVALSSIPEESSASKRSKPASDVGDPGHVKAIDRTETPQQMRQVTPGRPASAMSINMDTRPFSRTSNRSGTPSLRRVDRSVSGDLRAASRRGSMSSNLNMRASPRTIPFEAPPTPPLYDDEEDVQPMSDIFVGTRHSCDNHALTNEPQQGYGGAAGAQVSPTRPPSVRKRQSMQITDLETRLDQLVAENRALQEAQRSIDQTSGTRELRDELATQELHLREKDVEINQIRTMLQPLQEEVARLTEINAGLTEANRNLVNDTNGRYATLQTEHAQAHEQWQSATRELDGIRAEHKRLTLGMRDVVEAEVASALADKNAEILRLREELDVATERVRALQVQIQSNRSNDTLVARDEDYFDGACQKLCQHVQQWVLRFSKLSDNRVCRLSTEINDDKIEGRIDNAILDGSDADALLSDRVRRRDVFMCIVMTMAWEYIFTRYLFGMDREQRQKLKTLEKMLSDVGPPRAVAQWRALTLTLLSKRPEFAKQTSLDTEAVAHEIFSVLCTLLPPPSQAENTLLVSLQKVIGVAVDLSIEMRTQRAEYIMLPPLQPEYDSNGDLVRQVHFNASLMNERSGMFSSNEELESERAVVKIVLFPLVVKKGDDYGEGEEEIVVCPAQVLVQNETNAKGKKVVRVMSGAMEIDDPRKSRQSLVSTAPGSVAF